jgi:predicted HAD superfamily Cof-like phosphohydrolase
MDNEIAKVKLFHQAVDAPIADQPALLETCPREAISLAGQLRDLVTQTSSEGSRDPLVARVLMSLEETAEWLEAHAEGDVVAAADAWADRCYVLVGDAVACGLPAAEIFEAVHESNMTKATVDPINGKAIKGKHYKRPRIEAALAKATCR